MIEGWLLDAWRVENQLALWIKTPENKRVLIDYKAYVYIQACESARQVLDRRCLPYTTHEKTLYDGSLVKVYKLKLPSLNKYERFVKGLEMETRHRVPLFDADIPPEQRIFYENDIYPGCWIELDENITKQDNDLPSLSEIIMHVQSDADPRTPHATITYITVNDAMLVGDERQLLLRFKEILETNDPDVISCNEAFAFIPLIARRAEYYNIKIPLNRFDDKEIRYAGGSSFHSYGLVRFRDYGVRLRGRFLIDTGSVVGQECDAEAIFALCKLSGSQFQQLASRSAGSVFQKSLMREMVKSGCLVPFKQKPIPEPVSLSELVKQDRAGLVLDAKVGAHKDVAEIDFTSMFPFLMWKKNISPEKMGSGEFAPGTNLRVLQDGQGYIARSLKPFIDLRMHYKQNPTTLNKRRAQGLKGVLVSANGYLRFREFKLGLPTTHVALCAWVREYFLTAMRIAESHGFTVLHGLVDSLYIHKPGLTEADVQRVISDIQAVTGIPIELEGIFKWIMFLPSINDPHRPVATRYYGAWKTGGFKVRGIEARQKGQPEIIRAFQEGVIAYLSRFDKDELETVLPSVYASTRSLLNTLHTIPFRKLSSRIVISKTEYDRDIPQKRIVDQLRAIGEIPRPGKSILFVHDARNGPVIEQHYSGNPDSSQYRKLLERVLFGMLQPLGIDREEVKMQLEDRKQLRLDAYQESAPMEIIPLVTGLTQTKNI